MTDFPLIVEETIPNAGLTALRRGLAAYNVQQEPRILAAPGGDFALTLHDDSGRVAGGLVAEMDWGWMYVDTLWVDDRLRGRGWGARLMHAAEAHAAAAGITRCFLSTTDFQAPDFYRKLGYEVWGVLEDCPRGYRKIHLRKADLRPGPVENPLTLHEPPPPGVVDALEAGLLAHARESVPYEQHPLAIFLRPDGALPGDGNVLGGIVGFTAWDWFNLQFLWLDDSLRGRGWGAKLLAAAEAACARRGVHAAHCDTVDFQAPDFYRHHGFTVFGTLDDRPPGHTSSFLQKRW